MTKDFVSASGPSAIQNMDTDMDMETAFAYYLNDSTAASNTKSESNRDGSKAPNSQHRNSSTSLLRTHILKKIRFSEEDDVDSDAESDILSTQSAPVGAPVMLTESKYHIQTNVKYKINRRRLERNTVNPRRAATPTILLSAVGVATKPEPQPRRSISNSNLAPAGLANGERLFIRRTSSINLPPISKSPAVSTDHKNKKPTTLPTPLTTASTSRSHESVLPIKSLQNTRPKYAHYAQDLHHHNGAPCTRCFKRNSSVPSIIAQTFGHSQKKPLHNPSSGVLDELLHIDEVRRISEVERNGGRVRMKSPMVERKSLADMFNELQDCRYLRKPGKDEMDNQ